MGGVTKGETSLGGQTKKTIIYSLTKVLFVFLFLDYHFLWEAITKWGGTFVFDIFCFGFGVPRRNTFSFLVTLLREANR